MVSFSYCALVPSSISSSWFDFPSCSVSRFNVTKEEFHAFHKMDRLLYSRLVVDLSRDLVESLHVIAIWLWLEKNGENIKIVGRLLESSNWIVDAIANEAAAIHKCLSVREFPCCSKVSGIPLTRSLMKNNLLSLQFFRENRESIVTSVTLIVKDVMSLGVFDDIIDQRHSDRYIKKPNMLNHNVTTHLPSSSNITTLDDQRIHKPFMHQTMPASYMPQMAMSPQMPLLSLVNKQEYLEPFLQPPSGTLDLTLDRNKMNHEIGEILSSLRLEALVNKEKSKICREEIDERTIFLTFSKGYLVLEHEIWEFFTRKHGNIIEEICMQEAPPQEQPLYARLVIRHASIIEKVLEFKSKAKFNINGKHVWARKYVKKSTMK